MKKLFLLAMIALASVGINAQTVKGEGSLMGNIGYQTNYERFGLGVQGRYAIANNLRIAPDVTFYFPKDKITGLDVSVNFHYVFNFKKDGQGFSVYPLAGIGMQNNFYGKKSMEVDGKEIEIDRSNSTKFAFNLGGGITLPISERSYLNAEARFMFAKDDNVAGIWVQILMNYPKKFDSKLFTHLRKSPILHWALSLLPQKEILNHGII